MSENEINILSIDSKIVQNFKEENEMLPDYKIKLNDINKTIILTNISNRVRDRLIKTKNELVEHIDNVENNTSLNFYISESAELLEKFKRILNFPMKDNFIGKRVKR